MAYLTITTLQNNVLSPIVYGNRMKLNPTAILLGLMLWYLLWGVAGAFLAVPILAAFNVYASRTPSLKSLSTFLSD
ncbi:MAG: AI-2E family transporter [Gemmatimonas sp.]